MGVSTEAGNSVRPLLRSVLLGGASGAAVASMLSFVPAHAQLRNMAAALGHSVNVVVPNAQNAAARPVISPSMAQIQQRQAAYRARITAQANVVANANSAARAAALAAAQNVRNGLGTGGLDPVANGISSSLDASGLNVWEGASKPTETVNGALVDVTINQTQSRALLSWNTFNVGRDTTLTFNQQGNKDWVAVNRVVGGINPVTGLLDPTRGPAPSQILGSIKADGTVYVLNRSGVLFGATSQVNLNSLVASSLELGSATIQTSSTTTRTLNLQERNNAYLQNGLLNGSVSGIVSEIAGETHGSVDVAAGGRINSTGGFVILAAPRVTSGGELKTAPGGQISLQAGNQVDAYSSSGAAESIDRYVRGLVLTSVGGGSVDVSGSIDAPTGYISLGTDQNGTVDFSGILTSTTSVSRNGKVSLTGGTITIAPDAAISILPDASRDTIPLSAESIANFKTSQIDIGSHNYLLNQGRIASGSGGAVTDLLPALISIGQNATIQAPSADVNIGGTSKGRVYSIEEGLIAASKVDIASGAVIDVSGIADVLLDATRNQLVIDPAKRNELRDTPTYREPTTDGSFTLNGQTLYVDPRVSGVREDGVAWIGSPLLEAGSLAEQIGGTASELMTKGGNVTLATLSHGTQPAATGAIPGVTIASNAVIDFAGGWVRYQDGFIRTSKLVTQDGRVVDIAEADPNDRYVAVAGGFVENLPQLTNPRVYANAFSNDARFEQGYAEGRDAGSLTIKAPTASLNGTLHGEAIAGARQITDALSASASSKLSGDVRHLQANGRQLAAGGLLHIQSTLGGDIVVGGPGSVLPAGTTYLSEALLNTAGLSGLNLQTSGKVDFASGSAVKLADGGAVNIDAGRAISFNGKLTAAGGSITARTFGSQLGSLFDTQDDLSLDGVITPFNAPGMFDISVNSGAELSTRGRWVNDLLSTDGNLLGGGYTSGGSITLVAAPHIAAFTDASQTRAVDLSGSILVNSGSLLDVSGGGYVSSTGALALNGKGGNVSLIDETVYFQLEGTDGTNNGSLTDRSLFRSDIATFNVTPVPGSTDGSGFSSAVIPDVINARVSIADDTIRGFGFKGGGTFKLVTPDLNFGSSGGAGTAIPLDFLQKTGFGTLDLSAWNTSIIDNVFSNGRVGKTAIAATEVLKINAGETLNLTQAILPSILSQSQIDVVRGLANDTDVSRVAALAPTSTLGDYDNLAAHLVLGGLTELQVLKGGTIAGAPKASITTPKLYNDGLIRIAGGSITQRQILPVSYAGGRPAIGIHKVEDQDGVDRGAGLSVVFGAADSNGKFDELANNALGLTNSNNGNILSNRELVSKSGFDRQIYYLGALDADQGIVFTGSSVTDLSGISIRNPRAPVRPGGGRIATGRMIEGGSIHALGLQTSQSKIFDTPSFDGISYKTGQSVGIYVPSGSRSALRLDAASGATIDLSGASDVYDIRTGTNSYTPTAQWSGGGTLSALGGGSIAGARVNARGGAAQALGGTIEWLNPTLSQGDLVGTTDTLSADHIMASGFSSFIARGKLDTSGNVNLSLGRSFLLMSPDYLGVSVPGSSYYNVSIASHGDLTISAPHIGLLSSDPNVGSVPDLLTSGAGTDHLQLKGDSIDVAGGVTFGASFDKATLEAAGDIRFIGVQPVDRAFNPGSAITPSLSGGLVMAGDLTLRAAQVYATTGTGNLQQIIENPAVKATPFIIASLGGLNLGGAVRGKPDATIRIESNGAPTPPAPLSAGSYLSILAPNIEQAGVLRAPLGRLDLGSRSGALVNAGGTFATVTTSNLTLENGSITSVSANGLSVPYGSTTDLTEVYFSPSVVTPITRQPAAQLSLSGANIVTGVGATVDASGGGDTYAYEFVSGTGGSRDILSRFNSDAFSSNDGFQYADGRQVYAIVPAATAASVALYDPLYSDDYAALYGRDVGKTVKLDAAPGLAAGDYVLLPAKYALLPGAMRLVENVGSASAPGASGQLLDGSIVVGGVYGVSGTSYAESERRSFTVQPQSVVKSYSRIETTSGNTSFGKSNPLARVARDAARIVLDPLTTLNIGSAFNTAGQSGGRGSQVDILGDVLTVVSSLGSVPTSTGAELAVADIAKLNADSLLIGGTRTDLADGSTDIRVTAKSITIANDAANPLSAPEILLAVDGARSNLLVADGASLVATGTLTDTRTTDYNVASFTLDSGGNIVSDNSGAGAVLRLANGPERLINRSGALAASATSQPVTFSIGTATLAGTSLALDSSRNLTIDAASNIQVKNLGLSGDNIVFSSRTFGVSGLVITPELEQSFSSIDRITLRSPKVIGFTPGAHSFNNMAIDAPGLRVLNPVAGQPSQPLSVDLNIAGELKLGNSFADLGSCTQSGPLACLGSGNSLAISADTVRFGSGTIRTYGYDAAVSVTARSGAYYEGKGALDVGGAALSLTTPFLVDRGTGAMPTDKSVQADLTLLTTNSIAISAPAGSNPVAPSTPLAPGARLAFGTLANAAKSVSVDNVLLRATAGTIDIKAQGDIALTGTTTLATPGYAQKFGEAADQVTVSAGGGTVALLSKTGGIDLGSASRISIGSATGKAGSLKLIAAQGTVALGGTINADAPDSGTSFTLDSGLGSFDFTAFAANSGSTFTGDVAIRTGAGDLNLGAGQSLKLASLSLTADGGAAAINGTIDTSGVNGGDIALFARDGVTLGQAAVLDTHADGYADTDTRQASAGDITLGVSGTGAIAVVSGARLDLGARRLNDRLVAHQQVDPRTQNRITAYTFVEADKGGALLLRAPAISQPGGDTVNIGFAGSVTGARDVTIEGYRSYDLASVAANSTFTGVTVANNVATLDVGAAAAGKANFLADTSAGTMADFIRTFDISASRANLGSLTSLANYHEKPGVELSYNGDIVLASNWNLGAGTVNVAAALADGDMQLSGLGAYANGQPRYDVVAGREAHLFQNHVDMLYRVGGRVDGEAGMLTLRAGRDLDLKHSITDGFFAFSDQTDPDYISYQLGGGQRSYHPSINISCGNSGCDNLADFAPDTTGTPTLPPRSTSINITLSQISPGAEIFTVPHAPYSAAANAAAPTGLQAGGAGDPLGSAQLFPLLADGSAADSFGIRLVGGAGGSPSANPLHVDAASGGSMILEGESSYTLNSVKATAIYGGDAKLDFGNSNQFLEGDVLQAFAERAQVDPATLKSRVAHVQFGAASPAAVAFLQQEALSFFAAFPNDVQFIYPRRGGQPTGFAATFERFAQFLQSPTSDGSGQTILQRFGALIADGSFAYKTPQPRGNGVNPQANTVYVRSLVRTGTGSINVAAAADVDLRNGASSVTRNQNGGKSAATGGQVAQVGGTAIYTAGHVVNPTAVSARVAGTSQFLTIDPTAYLPQADLRTNMWVPDNTGRLQANPVFARGGGAISVSALNDVLGRRDVWSEAFNPAGGSMPIGGTDRDFTDLDMVGSGDQRWRTGDMGGNGLATTIRVNAQQFSSGLGTLGGGDIRIDAGGDARELTVALDTTVATGDVGSSFGSMVFGGGNLDVVVGHDVAGGRFDVSSGEATIRAGGNIGSSGLMTLLPRSGKLTDVQEPNLPEIRLTDAVVSLKAGGEIALGKITALGVNSQDRANTTDENALGYYTGTSAVIAQSSGDFSIKGGPIIAQTPLNATKVLPATLDVTSFSGDIDLGRLNNFLYPGATGNLSLLAAGTLRSGAINLDDGDASLLPGIFSANRYDTAGSIVFGRRFGLPVTLPNSSDADRRAYHNQAITHANDKVPARIAVGGDLTDLTLFLSKQGRISAGRDIVNMVFTGQNLGSEDITRITAGRDITATTTRTGSTSSFAPDRGVVQGNVFTLGGPGALFLEAGRNMGPFLNSATIDNVRFENGQPVFSAGTSSYGGGIFAVGNDYNPWLAQKSADIYAFFGVGPGMNFAGLRETYVNPANTAALDGDLFEQNLDVFGNKTPDRNRPIYAPILIEWMQTNQAAALIATFGTTNVTAAQAYSVFTTLPDLVQRRFLLDKVYFNELAAPSRPDGNSYLQYVRGYRAVETLFPAAFGYTANDLSGASNGGAKVTTGNLDLRLAAIETTRDSSITILGPGGNAVLGSVVRTSAQAAGRAYQPQVYGDDFISGRRGPNDLNFQVRSIPVGYEGVLSLRGGAIHGFTDGDFRLNQSRLFAQQSGDIVLWSSNGDLNAGQGPKNAANVPPIVLRFSQNGGFEVDTASGVVGAGIAGFAGIRRLDPATGQYVLVDVQNDADAVAASAQLLGLPAGAQVTVNGKTYTRDVPSVTLIAPVGTIDAGDAGVRASGDIFVAAAKVANADNFKVGGSTVGVPALTSTPAPATPASAASATANVFRANQNDNSDQRSRITVDVLGVYNFNDSCVDDQGNPKENCAIGQ